MNEVKRTGFHVFIFFLSRDNPLQTSLQNPLQTKIMAKKAEYIQIVNIHYCALSRVQL